MADWHIGFIGLGQMGLPIARHLLKAGYQLRIFNRSPEKVEPLVELGARAVMTPEETAEPGSLVLSMVADDAALEAIATEALAERLGEGGVHAAMSTVSPATTRRLAERHVAYGASYVAAPVFGRPDLALARKLWITMAGPVAARQRVRPLLEVVSQGVYDFGEQPEAASVVKLAGNFLSYAAVEAMAEAAAFAEKQGVPRAAMLSMLTETLFNAPVYQAFSRRIIDADFEWASFATQLGHKDTNLIQEAAVHHHVPMPLLDLLRERYRAALDQGRGEEDVTVLALGAAEDAGLNWEE